MCGITAYCGNDFALPFLMQGLSKLEYRGYDSAGVTTLESGQLLTVKCKGRLKNLEDELTKYEIKGNIGIGHTRWATHGIPSNLNSHPHTNEDQTISLVHNGIIENYRELKEELIKKGYQFQSETDSEVVVQLLDLYDAGNIFEATKKVLKKIEGSYALCIVSTKEPDKIVVAKKDSPLIIGKVNNAYVAASDIPALLEYTKDVYFLNDLEMAIMEKEKISFFTHDGQSIEKKLVTIPYDLEAAQKDGYDTFMLKEIYEQPHVINETLRGRINHQEIVLDELKEIDFSKFNKIYFVACGTAYHACLCGAQVLEKAIKIPVTTTPASEFRYSDPLIDEYTLAIFVSQSGETADTLAALRLAKQKSATTIAIANVLGSTISRDAQYVLYTCAGPEIAVASTKAYTTQLVLLFLFAYYVAQQLGKEVDHALIQQLSHIPEYVHNILKDHQVFENYAKMLENLHDAYFIGRRLDYASVLEGALKLKEVSYVHADAYVAGELKHGPIALIEAGSVVIAVATQPHIAAKTISNIQETIARGAKVILFTTHGEKVKNVENTYYLPDVAPTLQSILVAIPLQLIAYYTAGIKGCDVDKPRNLAKSVTVE
ncbi:glutamine--fructose-6-phosphate transaminase (isomerizing) [Candidatus Stoquefichus massiliensis]|uniref:glutamine--fructose-6-phosphate transaminase (isomerizing) n=1 Tax=Candidatus Stoquefichus massiliensis TaxID=1470350 RepID=UPI0004852606|nr:glutamine--fructose-6-phosphate transaminase (isomerizing) [Candidatus Stoquefichus massiliensis]